MLAGALRERLAALTRRITQMEDDVGDRRVVELARLVRTGVCRQLELPLADRSSVLEGQIPLVAQVGIEQSAVVEGRTRHDRLSAAEEVVEPVVLRVLA